MLAMLCGVLMAGTLFAQETDKFQPPTAPGQAIQPPQEPEPKRTDPKAHLRLGNPVVYQSFTPCRVVDTRNSPGDFGGPKLFASGTRNFNLVPSGGGCGDTLPAGAKALAINVTITDTENTGFLTIWPGGQAQPNASVINWTTSGTTIANAIIVPVGADGSINVFSSQGTHLILDISGYFLDTLEPNDTLLIIGQKPGSSVILGINQSATGFAGVQGFGDGSGSTPRYGVYGNVVSSAGSNSAGVIGVAPGTGIQNPGFRSGVLGVGGPSSNIPVIGIGDFEGVRGINTSGLTSSVASYGSLGFTDAIAIFGQGNSSVTGTKSFVEPHPTDPDKVIRYVSLEGPEAGTYFRGRAKFEGKRAVIEVPESFRMVTEEEGLSIQVTPIGKMAKVAVVEISLGRIVVKASENVEFFYTVNGVRRGFKDFEVIVKADREFTPSSPDAKMPTSLSAVQKQRLIANGIYNADGTVNMLTARRLGWDREWERKQQEVLARRNIENRK